MSAPPGIEIATDGALLLVTLSNPDRRNAVSASMWHALAALCADGARLGGSRAVILRGAGGECFSAGADITGFEEARAGAADAKGYDDLVEETCRAFEALPLPTIALLQGPCVGAGASLAASCDLRVAAEDSFIMVPAARLGLGYDPRGIARFLRVFGPGLTRELLFTARPVGAARIHASGGVQELAPADAAEERALALARRIAGLAPLTLRAAKASLRALEFGEGALMDEALALTAQADGSADYREGRSAFAQKRKPTFHGS